MAPRRAQRNGCSDGAVSEVLGTILLTGITVALFTGLGLAVASFAGPVDQPQASLAVSVAPGEGGWGTGDEALLVQHLGGEAVPQADLRLVYAVNGGASSNVTGAAFAFSNGTLTIGETWARTMRLAATDSVSVQLVAIESNALLATQTLVPSLAATSASCPSDAQPPTVGSWQQTPANLTSNTTTTVRVEAVLTDDCSGPAASSAPSLLYRTSPDASYVSLAMTETAPNQWSATIPAPSMGWSSVQGSTLQYYLSPLVDARGNSGQSAVRADFIDVSRALTWPANVTARPNATLEGAPAAAFAPGADADGRATATLREGVRTNVTVTLLQNVTVSASGWSNPANANRSDNNRATVAVNNPNPLRVGFTDPPTGGPVLSVKVLLEQRIEDHETDGWAVQACAGGSCGPASATQPGSENDAVRTFDITNLLPTGLASWNQTDLAGLEVNILPIRKGGRDDTWGVDNVSVEVLYGAWNATLDLEWNGSALAGTRTLVVGYNASDEAFTLQVWNWTSGAWTTRATLDATSPAEARVTLAAAELAPASRAVRARIVDANPGDFARASGLAIDYAAVVVS